MEDGNEMLVAIWRQRGWIVIFEENRNREQAEWVSCEVLESTTSKPLPRGLGYVCGYGATDDDAVANAKYKLEHEEPE